MTVIAIVRASAALLFCMVAVVSGQAQAQNYDGVGLLRFGVFGQFAPTEFDIQRPADAEGSVSETGGGAGVSYGYDLMLHNGWILGVESDIAFDTLQADRNGREFRVDYLATVRGRFGSYVRPDLLLYGTAGVAFLGVGYEGLRSPLTGLRFNDDSTLFGWTVGAGAEFDFHGITLFGEYLFAGYDSMSVGETIDTVVDEVATTRFIKNEVDVDQHIFRLGVKFIIGHDFRTEEGYGPLK